MKHDKRPGATVRAQRVDRVAGALIRVSAQGMGRPGFRALARAALDELAPELRHDPPKSKDRIARALWEASHPPANEASWATITGVLRQVYEDRAEALLAALVHHGVPAPEGCEAVWLPTEVVDRYGNRDYEGPIAHACREAQARRPKPEPRTERVPAIDALGRKVVSYKGSARPTFVGDRITRRADGQPCIRSAGGGTWQLVAPDGKVEVLAEDGGQ